MNFKIEKLGNSQLEIFFEISDEEFNQYYEKAVLAIGQNLKVPGFRPGKASKEIIEREVKEEGILHEAADLAINDNYFKVVSENKIEAVLRPEITITKIAKNNPFEFKAKVAVLPEFVLPDYKSIASKVAPNNVAVENKEVEDALSWLQKSRAKFFLKAASCQKKDWVKITFSSPQIKNGEQETQEFILGEGGLVPGFEENLEGMAEGQEKEFSLKFPLDHYKKDIAGKEIFFKAKMESVQTMELPDINDNWAKEVGNFASLDAMKKNIEKGIKEEKEISERQKRRDEILNKIREACAVETPDLLVQEEAGFMLQDLKKNVNEQVKIDFQDYLTKINKTEEELKKTFLPEAERRVKNSLILREIAKKEKIEVLENEIMEKINDFLKHYPSVESAKKEVDLERLKSYYENAIMNDKIFKILEEIKS